MRETIRPPGPGALISVGLVGGVLAGFFGVGGGLVMVPLLLWWARLNQREAQATSLLAIAPAALVGTASYAVGGVFPIVPALLVAVGAIIGAQLGALLLRRLSLGWLEILFIIFVGLMAITVTFHIPQRGSELTLDPPIAVGLITVGVVMGIAAGLFGIGGGIIAIPALMMLFGVGDLEAKGISLISMIPAAISGGISHIRHKTAVLQNGLWVAAGALMATPLGALGAFVIPAEYSNIIFGAFALFVTTALIIRAVKKRSR